MKEIAERIDTLFVSWGLDSKTASTSVDIILLIMILLIVLCADLVCRYLIVGTIEKIVKKTKATWDDILFDRRVMNYLSHIVAPILFYILIPIAIHDERVLDLIQRFTMIYIIAIFLRFSSAFLAAVYYLYSMRERARNRPLKGLLQIAQVILFFIGGILIISLLTNQSPKALFTGLGASAAILMLVFKDSIMGVVSGIQLTANNMLRVGDWIAMPKYGADGTVIEVTLNTVKVRNWDNTITTIPPYALVSDSFQNWRGMEESGGRRIKRSVNIDMNSVKFCTPEMIERYRKICLLSDYVLSTEQKIEKYNKENNVDTSTLINGQHQTNLGVFRAYLNNYLKSLPTVNQQMTCMVRQLQPTETGIPMELYFFSAVKDWVPYEGVQADVFDHVLAIIPEFDLRVFQNPSGDDLRSLHQ